MKTFLKTAGLWLIKQQWFQFELVKLLTLILEKTEDFTEKTKNSTDDKVVSFVKRNKQALLSIAISEAKLDDTPIDTRLKEVLGKVK